MTGPRLEGVVLCRVRDERLAVPAEDVVAFEAPGADVAWAGRAFGDTDVPEGGKILRSRAAAVRVDSVEVHGEALSFFEVPPLLRAGGLAGFVLVAGELWPVLSVERLAALSRSAA